MAPKAKIVREQIIEKAFEILRDEGFQTITVRRLSSELNCSTQPIYYCFENMGELKKELYLKGKSFFMDYVQSIKKQATAKTDFLELGIAYIRAAKLEQKVFHFICLECNYSLNGLHDLVKDVQLPKEAADLFLNLWLYAHGIACIIASNEVPFDEEEIRGLLWNAYQGFSNVKQ